VQFLQDIEAVLSPSHGGADADFLDALIVGMDMLNKTSTGKAEKKIFLITDAGCAASDDGLEQVIAQFGHMDAKLNVIGISFEGRDDSDEKGKERMKDDDDDALSSSSDDDDDDDSDQYILDSFSRVASSSTAAAAAAMSSKKQKSKSRSRKRATRDEDLTHDQRLKRANEALLHKIAKAVDGVVILVGQALELLTSFSSRTVLQRTNFRGLLRVGPSLAIRVWCYVKTMECKFPSMKKMSTLAPDACETDVQMERCYQSLDDPDQVVESHDELVRAYNYGKTLVPFTNYDMQLLNYQCAKCMDVIGFARSKRVPRQHYMSNLECVTAESDDADASLALAALARALHETDRVAIVRYVKRSNGTPQLGALVPYIKSEWEGLLYVKLPFAEDLRQFQFAPLGADAARAQFRPSQTQLDAAEALIRSLDLMHVDKDDDGNDCEGLRPSLTYNPVLQHFNDAVRTRAIDPSAELPPINATIMNYLKPNKKMLAQANQAIDNFRQAFPLKPVESAAVKSANRGWAEPVAEVDLASYAHSAKKQKGNDGKAVESSSSSDAAAAAAQNDFLSVDQIASTRTSSVGSVDPVRDFNAMCARRDEDLVDKAIEEMSARIVEIVNGSVQGALYPKAYECLVALRAGCIRDDEPDAFNKFLHQLRSYFKGKRRDDFWQQHIVAHRMTLIASTESDESTVSAEEATQFLLNENPASLQSQSLPTGQEAIDDEHDSDSDNADDLLDLL
jgi:ATP-dependent DNA helicase 2 subunit 2